jgi:hypothetical protein
LSFPSKQGRCLSESHAELSMGQTHTAKSLPIAGKKIKEEAYIYLSLLYIAHTSTPFTLSSTPSSFSISSK